MTCCDMALNELYEAANSTILGKTLGVTAESGFSKIRKIITIDEIEICRERCQREYKSDRPKVEKPPPKSNFLGKKADKPAKSCNDVAN